MSDLITAVCISMVVQYRPFVIPYVCAVCSLNLWFVLECSFFFHYQWDTETSDVETDGPSIWLQQWDDMKLYNKFPKNIRLISILLSNFTRFVLYCFFFIFLLSKTCCITLSQHRESRDRWTVPHRKWPTLSTFRITHEKKSVMKIL